MQRFPYNNTENVHYILLQCSDNAGFPLKMVANSLQIRRTAPTHNVERYNASRISYRVHTLWYMATLLLNRKHTMRQSSSFSRGGTCSILPNRRFLKMRSQPRPVRCDTYYRQRRGTDLGESFLIMMLLVMLVTSVGLWRRWGVFCQRQGLRRIHS